MAKGPFTGEQFIATESSTAEDKAKFGNTFLRFVKSGFDRKQFTKSFYQRLSMCFSHIAHYNIFGFYSTWFERDLDRLAFLKHTLRYPCYGDPKFTFSDVERAIQVELTRLNLIPVYEERIAVATRARELKELDRLKRKYEPVTAPDDETHGAEKDLHPQQRTTTAPESVPSDEGSPLQGNLFT